MTQLITFLALIDLNQVNGVALLARHYSRFVKAGDYKTSNYADKERLYLRRTASKGNSRHRLSVERQIGDNKPPLHQPPPGSIANMEISLYTTVLLLQISGPKYKIRDLNQQSILRLNHNYRASLMPNSVT